MTIGQRIGELAKKKNINLHKLADKAEIPYNTLYSIVRRNSNKIDPSTVRKIADALNVPMSEIWAGKKGNFLFDDAVADIILRFKETIIFASQGEIRSFYGSVNENDITAQQIEHVVNCINDLNQKGQQEAIKRVEELTKLAEYQRTAPEKTLADTDPNTDTTE